MSNRTIGTTIITNIMGTEAIHFDAQRALRIATGISRPRRLDSQIEAQVGRELATRLEQAGFQVRAEAFSFADAYSVFLKLEIIACQALVVATIWLYAIGSSIRTLTAALLILQLGLISALNRAVQHASLVVDAPKHTAWVRLCRRLGRSYHATNYVARLPDSPVKTSCTHLLLVAHYDSKSQRIPLAARMILIVVGIGGALLFAALILVSPLQQGLPAPALALAMLAFVAGMPLWFLDMGDDSPGAIDNASSVGVVMELAQVLAKDPLVRRKLDLTVLLTSAEEVDTMGAVAYVQRHAKELRHWDESGQLYVLNFDGVGVDGPLRWVGRNRRATSPSKPCLLSLVRQSCKELSCRIKNFNLPGALYDHLPFDELGLDAGTLVAIGRASLGVHTRRDTADRLDLQGFERAGQVAIKVIQALIDQPRLGQPQPSNYPRR